MPRRLGAPPARTPRNPAGTDPGYAEEAGRLRRRDVLAAVRDRAQQLLDELEGLRAEPLGERPVGAGDPEEPVHVGLLGALAGHPRVGLLVVLEPYPQVVVGERLRRELPEVPVR